MVKKVIFNIVCMLGFAIAVSAANEVSVDENLGKEKPKGFVVEKNNNQLDRFSLGSQMKFKGDKVIKSNVNYINFNTSITYQKGHNSYVVPFSKKVVLNRVTFNPNELLRNYVK